MERSNSFFLGQMVECRPDYILGSTRVPPSVEYAFKGIAIIVKMDWPDQAHVFTKEGDVLCLCTDKLMPIKKEKK